MSEQGPWFPDHGEEPTEEEWRRMPDRYLAECYKQCYLMRVMEKGHTIEYGVRGVYRCSGCGYAWAPACYPSPETDWFERLEVEDD